MKLLFACGGTGGHIFPAFSVAEELKKRDHGVEILYVCGKKDIENAIFKIARGEKVLSVESAPFGGALSLLNPVFLAKLAAGFSQSLGILRRERPDVVVGFGGYFAFPVIFMARFMGIRTLVHEQNVVPGIANKFLAKFVDGAALSFSETAKYLPGCRNARVTGNPIRSAIEKDTRQEALKFFNFSGDKITFVVLGGSQGAESINTVFLDSLKFLPAELLAKIQALHLCGKMPLERAEGALRRAGISARVYSFFERMDLAYGVCDFAVGRAGATFLAEIGAKNIPGILIPYPYGSGHQLYNAQAFSRERDAVVAEQKGLSPEKLAGFLADFIRKAEQKRNSMPRGDRPPSSARARLADFILDVIARSEATKQSMSTEIASAAKVASQ